MAEVQLPCVAGTETFLNSQHFNDITEERSFQLVLTSVRIILRTRVEEMQYAEMEWKSINPLTLPPSHQLQTRSRPLAYSTPFCRSLLIEFQSPSQESGLHLYVPLLRATVRKYFSHNTKKRLMLSGRSH